jgi:hypothetical protein
VNASDWLDPCRTAGIAEVGHKVGKQILLQFLKSWERDADLSRNITAILLIPAKRCSSPLWQPLRPRQSFRLHPDAWS